MEKLRLVNKMPIFSTLQGEGSRVGEPATFIRFHGCDMHCGFTDHTASVQSNDGFVCDTIESWRAGSVAQEIDVEEAARLIRELGNKSVVITGGNPLLQAGALVWLRALLKEHHLTVETQGSIWHEVLTQFDLVSLSPKLRSLDMDLLLLMVSKLVDARYTRSPSDYRKTEIQIKIVVCDSAEVDRAIQVISDVQHSLGTDVGITYFIQPNGFGGSRLTADLSQYFVKQVAMVGWNSPIRLLPQCHKQLFKLP